VPIVVAVALALVVTVALVNIPEARILLRFGALTVPEQLEIGAYSVAYLLIADALQRAFIRTQPIRIPRTRRTR
jgi:hypothetical protein